MKKHRYKRARKTDKFWTPVADANKARGDDVAKRQELLDPGVQHALMEM